MAERLELRERVAERLELRERVAERWEPCVEGDEKLLPDRDRAEGRRWRKWL